MLPLQALYKNVFQGIKTAIAISKVILTADFPIIQFTIFPGLKATIGTVVGTFVVGETVTGGTSSTTGVVAAVTSTGITLIDVSGTFTNAETITGGTSGAHAAISAISTPNFNIKAFKSNNEYSLPPDPTLPSSSTNNYEQVMYYGEPGGVNYDSANPFNPNTGSSSAGLSYAPQTFVMGQVGSLGMGAVWAFIELTDYVGGALVVADINLFNHS